MAAEVVESDAHVLEVHKFLEENGINASKKRKRDIIALSPTAFEIYRLGTRIAACCKVWESRSANQSHNFIYSYFLASYN